MTPEQEKQALEAFEKWYPSQKCLAFKEDAKAAYLAAWEACMNSRIAFDASVVNSAAFARGRQGVEVNYRRLLEEYIEALARGLHYLENYERITALRTAREVSEATEGGIERYRNEPMYRRKVDMLVCQLTDITRKHLAASPQITEHTK